MNVNIMSQRIAIREPLHPSISENQVNNLVDVFYRKVRRDERLHPLFEHNMTAPWDAHLGKMKTFWRSVLLKTGEYKGQPVPAHQKIRPVSDLDFQRWLDLFDQTLRECIEPAARPAVAHVARRIATSLWLSRSIDPTINPPVWRPWNTGAHHDETNERNKK